VRGRKQNFTDSYDIATAVASTRAVATTTTTLLIATATLAITTTTSSITETLLITTTISATLAMTKQQAAAKTKERQQHQQQQQQQWYQQSDNNKRFDCFRSPDREENIDTHTQFIRSSDHLNIITILYSRSQFHQLFSRAFFGQKLSFGSFF